MKAFLVTDSETLGPRILEVFRRETVECSDEEVVALGMGASSIENSGARLVVLTLSPDPKIALACVRAIRKVQQTPIIAIGPGGDAELILRTLQDGANDFVDEQELEIGLTDSISRMRRQMGELDEPGRVIALVSSAGGCGTSTMAVNMAIELASEQEKCALFDLDVQTGDLGALLKLEPQRTLVDLCENVGRLDRGLLEQLLTTHESGVSLLASPRSYGELEARAASRMHITPPVVTDEGIDRALALSRKLFPASVVDIGHNIGLPHVTALRLADAILVVLRLDYTSVINARGLIAFLQRADIPKDRFIPVVNRRGQAKESMPADAEGALGMKIRHFVPDDPKRVNPSTNTGEPAILSKPRCRFSASIKDLVSKWRSGFPEH